MRRALGCIAAVGRRYTNLRPAWQRAPAGLVSVGEQDG